MNLQVGVKVLVKDNDGKYLFLKRSPSFKPGEKPKWDIPGGRINADEPLLDALTRELEEETGMRLTGIPLFVAAQDIFVQEQNLHVVRLTYEGSANGEIKLSTEHSEHEWMTVEEALRRHTDQYLVKVLERHS